MITLQAITVQNLHRITKLSLRDDEKGKEVFLSFVPTNTVAQALYDKLGFEDTGKIVDKEKLYVYRF